MNNLLSCLRPEPHSRALQRALNSVLVVESGLELDGRHRSPIQLAEYGGWLARFQDPRALLALHLLVSGQAKRLLLDPEVVRRLLRRRVGLPVQQVCFLARLSSLGVEVLRVGEGLSDGGR